MSLPTIACCHRDCAVKVWAPSKGRLDVRCSSATCMTCRLVALCLEHFETLRSKQQNLSCPNCGARRWSVVLFEPARLPDALASEVSEERGDISVRFVSTGMTVDVQPGPRPEASSSPPAPPAPSEWHLVRATELGAGMRAVGPDLAYRASGEHTSILLDGQSAREMHIPGLVRGAARCGTALLVEAAVSAEAASTVMWLGPDGRSGHLPNPFQMSVHGPASASSDRFVVVVDLPDGRAELREGRFDEPGRVRTRRVGRAWRLADDGAPPAVVGGHSGVVFGRGPEGYVPTCVRLDDGRETTIGAPQPPARVVVGASEAPLAAWINRDGEIRCGGPGTPENGLGTCTTDLLAVSADGALVAWVDGELHVADTQTGEKTTWAVPDDVVALGWRPGG